MSFMDKAKDFADTHDKHVDQGLEKAGDQIDERTGNKHHMDAQWVRPRRRNDVV